MTDVRSEVAGAARLLAANGLLIGTAGNVSVRHDDRVFATASGVDLAQCGPDDVTETDLTGQVVSGKLKPTSELDLHLAVYRQTFAQAVVHTHAPSATAVACATNRFASMPVLHYQQMLLGGELRIAEYRTFGTPELAAAVVDALTDRQAALMAHHGSVAIGSSLGKAVDNALLVEWLAALLLRVAQVADPQPLTEEQQYAVIEQAITLNYGSPQAVQE
ncbi:class II aldolase/adducin family protein [Cryptosporangium phraense]|uniref:Class II aldolase/adducin family protein n=1 Tax=Cryptosporangium phraense TaxID=2593070 RepID=A0A545AUP2_9ACTN|nr:class II aldolase/adducin family protein [Cryptosporangium phraense]TQS45059.1 class II aldolase/adducin family protein [Cryptosporangium phraense]